MRKRIGKVYLIGAGPGDPGLLTIRGREILRFSGVVIHDALVGPEILRFACGRAERINVGKRGKKHSVRQETINRLMVRHAKLGKTVARLKGGDPFLFGRGGEEAEFLARHGVPFEIVPGVSSITAVPAYAGIPVTDRRHNSMLTIVTGHAAEGPDGRFPMGPQRSGAGGPAVDWSKVSPDQTLVVLMGASTLKQTVAALKKKGWKDSTPVACIQWGTTSRQKVVAGTLKNILLRLARCRPPFSSPAVIVVGSVVNLRRKISWFSGS